jgi:hypothetical protein
MGTGSYMNAADDRWNRYVERNPFGPSWLYGTDIITYGNTTGREIVCQLLIDDGDHSKDYRYDIMFAELSEAGVGYGPHPQTGTVCVIDLADDMYTSLPTLGTYTAYTPPPIEAEYTPTATAPAASVPKYQMAQIPAGTFTMGSPASETSGFPEDWSAERPQHQVTLSAFSIGVYEVTQEL